MYCGMKSVKSLSVVASLYKPEAAVLCVLYGHDQVECLNEAFEMDPVKRVHIPL